MFYFRYLVTGCTFVSLGLYFVRGETTVGRIVYETTKILWNELKEITCLYNGRINGKVLPNASNQYGIFQTAVVLSMARIVGSKKFQILDLLILITNPTTLQYYWDAAMLMAFSQ